MALLNESFEEGTTGRVESSGTLSAVEELVANEAVAVLGHSGAAIGFSGLSQTGIDAEIGLELVGRGETLNGSDAIDNGGGGQEADALDPGDQADLFAVGLFLNLFLNLFLRALQLGQFFAHAFFDLAGGISRELNDGVDLLSQTGDGLMQPVKLGDPDSQLRITSGIDGIACKDRTIHEIQMPGNGGDGLRIAGVGLGLGHRQRGVFDDLGIDFADEGDLGGEGVGELLAIDAGGFIDHDGVGGID